MLKFFKKHKVLTSIVLTIYIAVLLVLVVPINKYAIDLPGNISSISDEIEINGKVSNDEFYSIYILSFDRPTLFQILVSNLNKKTEVYKRDKTQSSKTAFKRGAILEDLSFRYAIINAYAEAQKEDGNIIINYHLDSYIITYTTNSKLKLGDKFTHINNVSINDYDEETIAAIFKDFDTVDLTINNEIVTINKNDSGKFGIIYDPFYEITKAIPSYETFYEDDDKVGPSGGLLQTLKIYATLTNKTYNKVISGTGTITSSGSVGKIGGVRQKIYTAQKKVDIFFCPEENYEEALKAYKEIKSPTFKLVKVTNFNEAIEELNK